MSWSSRRSAWSLLALGLALPHAAAAQARGRTEFQLWGAALASQPAVFVGGLGLAWRDRGRTRIGGALAAGTSDDGRLAGRAELAWHFLLDPGRRHGLGIYGGGGLAISALDSARVHPWVQFVLGAETTPGGKHGFFVEAGFGGGARVAVGWRKRS